MNIATASWPTMSVPGSMIPGVRHGQTLSGCVFVLELSGSYRSKKTDANLDNPEVGR
jgi:hypothetical protein